MKKENKFMEEFTKNRKFRDKMLSIRDSENKEESFPITYSLIIILVISYIIQTFYLNSNELLINTLKLHTSHLFTGNFISIFTSLFLHVNLLHLIINLIALFVFGRIVEKHFKIKTIFIFLISGIIANIISSTIAYSFGNLYFSLGASSGIAGLIIFAILLSPLSFTQIFIIPIPIFILGWLIILSDIIGYLNPTTNTNYLAHLGGYSALLFIFFFLEFKNRKKIIFGFIANLILLVLVYTIINIIAYERISSLLI